MHRRTLVAVLFLFALPLHAETRVVDLGSRKVRVEVEGSGPSVILEAGFRSTLESWTPVIPSIAKYARVFAYDRAGLGQSDPVTSERTYVAMMHELHDLLQREKISPPYVFVGHSYGGSLARVFYALYPSEVSGIAFVDPMNEVYIRNDPQRAEHIQQQEDSLKGAPAGVLAEWAFLRRESDKGFPELSKYSAPPNVPMALITASIDRPPMWRQSAMDPYGAWIVKRDDSLLIMTPDSSHSVMRDQPELVIAAIRALLYPNPLIALARADDASAVAGIFRDQRARYPKDSIGPSVLNSVGYGFMRKNRIEDAIKVFALNVATFPANANAYDSLGEAYAARGDRDLALANYRKSLELDPSNGNAKQMIENLQAKP